MSPFYPRPQISESVGGSNILFSARYRQTGLSTLKSVCTRDRGGFSGRINRVGRNERGPAGRSAGPERGHETMQRSRQRSHQITGKSQKPYHKSHITRAIPQKGDTVVRSRCAHHALQPPNCFTVFSTDCNRDVMSERIPEYRFRISEYCHLIWNALFGKSNSSSSVAR